MSPNHLGRLCPKLSYLKRITIGVALLDKMPTDAAAKLYCRIHGIGSSRLLPDGSFDLCWIGPIMLPVLVKNRETSSPRSASRAIFSARAAFPDLRVFFIKSQVKTA